MARLAIKTLGGDGPDIVLIHGFGSDRLSWLGNSPALMTLGRVHAIDLPAHGESDADVGAGSPVELAERVSAAMVAHQIKRPHIVAHSLGGGIALLLAANDPARIASLALISPLGLGAGIDHAFLTGFPEISDAETAMVLLRRLVVRPELINKLTVQRTLIQLGRDGVRPALRTIARQIMASQSEMVRAASSAAANRTPRLVLWGVDDRINPADPARLEIFGGQSQCIPNTGHLPHIETAAAANAALIQFLRQLEPWQS